MANIMYVDNIRVEFDQEATVLDVCRKAGVEVPNFCFHSDLSVYGACRMCMVENLDTGEISAACTTKPKNGLRIRTNSARLKNIFLNLFPVNVVHHIGRSDFNAVCSISIIEQNIIPPV